MTTKNKPAHEIRLGTIKATIWANPMKEGGIRYSVTPSRIYKVENQQWKQTDSFGRDDLLALAKALELAYFWIFEQAKTAKAEVETEAEE